MPVPEFLSIGRTTPRTDVWRNFDIPSIGAFTYLVKFHKTNDLPNTWSAYIRLRPLYILPTGTPSARVVIGQAVTVWPSDQETVVVIPFPEDLIEATLGIREIEVQLAFKRFPYGSAPQLTFDVELFSSNRDVLNPPDTPEISFDGGLL